MGKGFLRKDIPEREGTAIQRRKPQELKGLYL